MSVNERQIGGDHYRSRYQHWDLVTDSNLGYLEANVSKYVARWKNKHGAEDLLKAQHYVDKILSVSRDASWAFHLLDKLGLSNLALVADRLFPGRGPQGIASVGSLAQFLNENSPDDLEEQIIVGISTWETLNDVRVVRGQLIRLAARAMSADGMEHPHGYDAPEENQ